MKRIIPLLIILLALPCGGWIYKSAKPSNKVELPPPPGSNRVLESGDLRRLEDSTTVRILETDAPNTPGSVDVGANSHTIVVIGWTNFSNAYGTAPESPTVLYATIAPNKNQTRSGDFGFPAVTSGTIPDDAIITSVVATAVWKVSTTSSIAELGLQIYNSSTPLGFETVVTNEPLTDTTATQSTTSGISVADLRTAGQIKVRVRATRKNTNTPFTAYLDYVKLTINYLY